jgi:hypothetical protein
MSAVQIAIRDVMTRLFAEFDRADQIGEVIDFLPSESSRTVVKTTLRRLLPLLNTTNASMISPAQFALLYNELFECDAEFTIVLLQALANMHDTEAIGHVERLFQGAGCIARRDRQRVRQAAQYCLAVLKDKPRPDQEFWSL